MTKNNIQDLEKENKTLNDDSKEMLKQGDEKKAEIKEMPAELKNEDCHPP
jgi:hypothetical protein